MTRYVIDPPNGHAFGFPKPFDGDIQTLDFDSWLRANGYPDEWIRMHPSGVGCRILERAKDDNPKSHAAGTSI